MLNSDKGKYFFPSFSLSGFIFFPMMNCQRFFHKPEILWLSNLIFENVLMLSSFQNLKVLIFLIKNLQVNIPLHSFKKMISASVLCLFLSFHSINIFYVAFLLVLKKKLKNISLVEMNGVAYYKNIKSVMFNLMITSHTPGKKCENVSKCIG